MAATVAGIQQLIRREFRSTADDVWSSRAGVLVPRRYVCGSDQGDVPGALPGCSACGARKALLMLLSSTHSVGLPPMVVIPLPAVLVEAEV